MEIIKKKVGNLEFVWDPNSYQGQGGWYKILKGRKNKPDGYGRSANAKEKKILGSPQSQEPIEEMSEDDEEQDPNSRAPGYREARRIRNRSLMEMFAENYDVDKGVGGSLKEGLSELAKAKAMSIKERLDPLSIANRMAGPFASWALGKALGRSEEDVQYFTGIGRRKKQMASKLNDAPVNTSKKIGSLDTSSYSTISENQQRRFRKGDGTATLLARMLNLMKKYHEEDILKQEVEHAREKEREAKKDKFNKTLSGMLKGAGAGSVGRGGAGSGADGESGSSSGVLGGILKAFLAGKAGRFLLSKLLKTSLGKALIRTKIGRFVVKNALRIVRPFKGSPLNVAKNLVTAPFKSITNFLTPSAKSAGETVKGASTASKISTVAEKPGFLKTAEDKIRERGTRMASEGAVKESGKVAAEATKESMKGIAKAGEAAEKVVGKKIPILGAILGTGFAIQRALEGDYLGASGEFASGLLSTVPGLGTAASLAIDGALIARDLSKEEEDSKKESFWSSLWSSKGGRGSQSGMNPPVAPAAAAVPGTNGAPAAPAQTGPKGEPAVVNQKGQLGYMKRNGRSSTFVPFETTPPAPVTTPAAPGPRPTNGGSSGLPSTVVGAVPNPQRLTTPAATPVPAEPNLNAVRLQNSIKQYEDSKLDSNMPMKPVVFQANKTMNTSSNPPDYVSYGGDFNVRQTDPSLMWVTKTNLRPV